MNADELETVQAGWALLQRAQHSLAGIELIAAGQVALRMQALAGQRPTPDLGADPTRNTAETDGPAAAQQTEPATPDQRNALADDNQTATVQRDDSPTNANPIG